MPLIKRYPNRKLYDTEAKQYITLDGIADLIRDGQDVQVVDYESGEDLTNLTLSQIIFEQEKKRSGFLPRTILTSLIRTGGDTLEYLRRNLQVGAEVAEDRRGTSGGAAEARDDAGMIRDWALLHSIDEQLSSILHHLNVPSYRDLKSLQEQVADLTARLERLSQKLADEGGEDARSATDESS